MALGSNANHAGIIQHNLIDVELEIFMQDTGSGNQRREYKNRPLPSLSVERYRRSAIPHGTLLL